MADPQKSVFISYRREASKTYAYLLFKELRERGFDVFFDYESLSSGRWRDVLLGEIGARAHFVVLLARGTLPRCKEPGDMLRAEIEHALRLKRNIVPVLIDGFNFKDSRYRKQLDGDLAQLPDHQGVTLSDLSERFLNASLDTLQDYLDRAPTVQIIPAAPKDQANIERVINVATSQPPPTPQQLSAEDYFNRALDKQEHDDLDGAVADYSEAIRFDPEYASAWYNRGLARRKTGDLDEAISDYGKAINLDPRNILAWYNRGLARHMQGDLDGAISDWSEAIQLDPNHPAAYNNRGFARDVKGDADGAIADYSEAIRLDPTLSNAYTNRGAARDRLGDLDGAIADYTEAIRLDPQDAVIYNYRGVAYYCRGDLKGALGDVNQALQLDDTKADYHDSRGEIYFALGQHTQARADFEQALKHNPHHKYALAGLPITLHALGETGDALARWRKLIEADTRYRDAEWVGQELRWRPELIAEARKLIAEL